MSAISGDFSVPEHEEFEVRKEEKTFTNEFTVLKGNWPVSTISTNRYSYSFFLFFYWRMHFTVYDAKTGNEVAHAIKNYEFSPRGIWNGSLLGLFRPHTLADFDFYDPEGNYIGCIDGRVLDWSEARFDFQDKEGTIKAYAREEKTQIYIRDYQTNGVVGYMKRHFDTGTEDPWKVKFTDAVDKRVVLIFAAYVVQNQSHFLKDI